ncbi:DinB family protein [Gorillibacterium sp. sgz5001074]|uniref:DinB family protein n=1 Tax=Gorillibacterium sp. sgz5001074 TaxID=3446695 RepID=UPI003F66D3F7
MSGAPLADQMSMIYEGNDWHASLRDLLRSVTEEQAAWKPAQGGHTIYEVLAHLAYSATEVASRLRGGQPAWNEAASWVQTPAGLTAGDWEAAITRYEEARQALASAIAAMTPEQLSASRGEGRGTFGAMAQQVVHHEAFHAGQIALLRRLQQQPPLM